MSSHIKNILSNTALVIPGFKYLIRDLYVIVISNLPHGTLNSMDKEDICHNIRAIVEGIKKGETNINRQMTYVQLSQIEQVTFQTTSQYFYIFN